MSFQDFSGSRSSARPSTTGPPNGGIRPQSASSSVASISSKASTASVGPNSLGQISESLLQYQRNVGILDKIVQSLTSNNSGGGFRRTGSQDELETQYRAQVDVISQLGGKVQRLIESSKKSDPNGTVRTTLIKLERDFQRVEQQAKALQRAVLRMKEQTSSVAAAANNGAAGGHHASAYDDYQQQMQLQMQEDRLNEEIMREREQEIRKINQGMHQVNEIYKDLAHIVASQQDQVDNVETHMEESRVNAEKGLREIEKANEKFGSANCVIS